jgi:hypothetical protein
MLAPGACSLRVACPTGEQGDGPGFSRPANRKVCLPTLSQLNREWPRCLSGQISSSLDNSGIRDQPMFMIATVPPWRQSEFALERPVESCFRLIPDITGDFCDTSRCSLE